ncbi:MAG: hypothetical protein QXX68_02850 [Candidatus Pacearchaeota archaeon]
MNENLLQSKEEKKGINITEKILFYFLKEDFEKDEIKIYSSLLTENYELIEKEFSRSRRYRLMRRLFDRGALIKIKSIDDENFKYLGLPPTFLYINDERIKKNIKKIEKIFLKKINLEELKFVNINAKNEKPFLLLLLNNLVNNNASLVLPRDYEFPFKLIEKKNLISYKKETENYFKGVIDEKILFEFFEIPTDLNGERELYGYIKFENYGRQYLKRNNRLYM